MAVLGPSKAELPRKVQAPSVDDEEEMSCQQPPVLPFARGVKRHQRGMANSLWGGEGKDEPFASGCLSCRGLVLPADNRRDCEPRKMRRLSVVGWVTAGNLAHWHEALQFLIFPLNAPLLLTPVVGSVLAEARVFCSARHNNAGFCVSLRCAGTVG